MEYGEAHEPNYVCVRQVTAERTKLLAAFALGSANWQFDHMFIGIVLN